MKFKMMSIFVLVCFIFVCNFCVGFLWLSSNDYYRYQWALKNNGNYIVDKGILADNHSVMYFDKNIVDRDFYFDTNVVSAMKNEKYDPGKSYAVNDFDIRWEAGYSIFKSVLNKRDTIVAIIDTGIDINHQELKENIWINSGEIPGNGIDDDNNGYVDDIHGYNFIDDNGIVFDNNLSDIHGTHAAGTMIAKHNGNGINGIAYDPHIKVMSLKILDSNGKGYMSNLIKAVNYAYMMGARICNISLGAYSYDESLDIVIKSYPDMLFVVAAGNGANYIGYSLDTKDVYPAKFQYDNVISVANACFDETRYVSSNYGTPVTIFAPGSYILSTVPDNNYGFLTGTSMAAPFVAATCAMIYSAYPNVPISMYKNILIMGAEKHSEFLSMCKSDGFLNIGNVMLLASTLNEGGR